MYRIHGLEQDRERRKLLLHQRRYCWWHYWGLRVQFMQRRVFRGELPDRKHMYCFYELQQGRKRRRFLLHQRRHCWWYHRVVHVLVRRGIRW